MTVLLLAKITSVQAYLVSLCFTLLCFTCVCLSNWRQDPPPAKRLQLTLLRCSGTKPAIPPRYACSWKSERGLTFFQKELHHHLSWWWKLRREILEPFPSEFRGYIKCVVRLHFWGWQNCICIYTRFLSTFANPQVLASSLLEGKHNTFGGFYVFCGYFRNDFKKSCCLLFCRTVRTSDICTWWNSYVFIRKTSKEFLFVLSSSVFIFFFLGRYLNIDDYTKVWVCGMRRCLWG